LAGRDKSGGEHAALQTLRESEAAWQSRQRLECGGFSTAFRSRRIISVFRIRISLGFRTSDFRLNKTVAIGTQSSILPQAGIAGRARRSARAASIKQRSLTRAARAERRALPAAIVAAVFVELLSGVFSK
jgi:hypothetical protein